MKEFHVIVTKNISFKHFIVSLEVSQGHMSTERRTVHVRV